ncbi:MAG: hypothetical protein ABS69_00320 [Nitrosomonadales bacterium SCN 54-20]|jgi:hypothetical protein|nr:MAG: hypothetical protein ABS69_00320 [Nitrosomonadales bacterium SCN 54-20]
MDNSHLDFGSNTNNWFVAEEPEELMAYLAGYKQEESKVLGLWGDNTDKDSKANRRNPSLSHSQSARLHASRRSALLHARH